MKKSKITLYPYKIAYYMAKSGINKTQLAKVLGVSYSTVQALMNGENVNVTTALALAYVFAVDLKELLEQ